MSESNSVILRYVAEGTYGTTPTNSSLWKRFPMTSESLTAEQNKQPSNIITATRVNAGMTEQSRLVSGAVSCELRAGWFDDLILAAMCDDAWDGNVATIGTTTTSFSFEKEFEDLTNAYALYDGIVVGGMTVSMSHGDFVNIEFALSGSDETLGTSSAVGTGSETEPTATIRSIASATGFGSFEIGGSANDAQIMSARFVVNNNQEGNAALGKLGYVSHSKGRADVSVELEAYLSDETWTQIKNARSGTTAEVSFVVSDPDGNSYTFNIPKAELAGATPSARGINQRVMTTLNFVAVEQAATITRTLS